MTKTARVIITAKCQRSCSYCVNTYKGVLSSAKRIASIESVAGFEEVVITGGEPMLDVAHTKWNINKLRRFIPKPKIFLYSALYKPELVREVLPLIDGLHFTLHSEANQKDLEDFGRLQRDLIEYNTSNKSVRAYISPDIQHPVTIMPYLWRRLEIKPWIKEGDCCLPSNETLFILRT